MGEMFRSATFKLTMWYLAIVMVISLLFSVVVYRFATSELTTGLGHQTQRIFEEYRVFNANPYLINHQANDLEAGEHHIVLRLLYFNLLVLVAAGFAAYLLARKTLQPIEKAHERQKRFTADVSHELRTPLTSLKMSNEVGLLDATASKTELRQTLQSNLDDIARMEHLIDSLLQLSRLDTNQTLLELQPVGSQAIIQTAVEQLHAAAHAKHITVTTKIDDQTLQADPAALTQLIVILLDNAIKYSPEHSAITLRARKQNDLYDISVSDQGQGIDPVALPHVFERFYRQDSARNQALNPGYGLGLSIAKLIADAHNGTVTLTSRPNKGTTATIKLPVLPVQGTKAPTDKATDKPVTTNKE